MLLYKDVMTVSTKTAALALWLSMSVAAVDLRAQDAPARTQPEELQPRVIGTAGTTMVGIAGFVDKFFSSERVLPTNYTAQIDIGRFVTQKFTARGGLAGTGSFGGDSDELATGSGAPALHAFGGVLYYFTPQSMWSAYSGAEYWAQLTQRTDPDAGSVIGKLGIQGAVSSRVSLFIEGGYGVGLTKGEEEETLSRFVGQLGVRLKL